MFMCLAPFLHLLVAIVFVSGVRQWVATNAVVNAIVLGAEDCAILNLVEQSYKTGEQSYGVIFDPKGVH